MGIASGPGRSRKIAVRSEGARAIQFSLVASTVDAFWVSADRSMKANKTGLTQGDQGELSGAQAAKHWCLFIGGLWIQEQSDIRRGVIDDGRGRNSGVSSGGHAVDHVNSYAGIDLTDRA